MHSQDARCLLDTGAVSTVNATNLARKLDLDIAATKKAIMVTDGTMKTFHAVAKNIPATFGELRVKTDFLDFDRFLVRWLMGIPKRRN